jgi:hypothetical protein
MAIKNSIKNSIVLALTYCASLLWAIPSYAQLQRQITFTGRVLPQCSFSMVNNLPASGNRNRFTLQGNRGSISTVCNTGSTLSVSIDRSASADDDSETRDLKIRFAAGGTGIYTNAHQGSKYQSTAIFRSQQVTSAIGDTAQFEVNLPSSSSKSSDRDRYSNPVDRNKNLIVVYASLAPQ